MASHWVKDYFTFTLKERIGIIVLISLILLVFFLPDFIPLKKWKPDTKEIAAFNSLARSLEEHADSLGEQTESHPYFLEPSIENSSIEKKLFPFDPNTASPQQWLQLGIKEKTVRTIQRYLSKGGSFRKPEDLQRIYGLRQQDYLRLKPYVRIANHARDTARLLSRRDSFERSREAFPGPRPGKERKTPIIELNSMDTSVLILLPGIGSRLAKRILNFRDRLGGFYAVEQVGETYGLPDSTFQKIRPFLILGNEPVHKININLADEAALKQHPYFSWAQARAVVEYRQQHGPFQRVEDLAGVGAILPGQIKRLIPYLSID
jgi:DNA uptake protein ComE-like DNA-binding protein